MILKHQMSGGQHVWYCEFKVGVFIRIKELATGNFYLTVHNDERDMFDPTWHAVTSQYCDTIEDAILSIPTHLEHISHKYKCAFKEKVCVLENWKPKELGYPEFVKFMGNHPFVGQDKK